MGTIIFFGVLFVLIYLAIGFRLSISAAPMSWASLKNSHELLKAGKPTATAIYEQPYFDIVTYETRYRRHFVDVYKLQWGNLPLWWFAWPWPVAAELVKEITGKYPTWSPNL